MYKNTNCLFCTTEINQCYWLGNKLDRKRTKVLTAIFRQLRQSFPFRFPSKCTVWDFKNQPFPFCKSCRNAIAKLCRLNDQITSIQLLIRRIVAKLAVLAISSNIEMSHNNVNLGSSKSALAKLSGRVYPALRAHNDNMCHCFRNTIINGYSPRVILKKSKAIKLEEENTECRNSLQKDLNPNAFNGPTGGKYSGIENAIEKAKHILGSAETFSDKDNDNLDNCFEKDLDLPSEGDSNNSPGSASKNNRVEMITQNFGDINKILAEEGKNPSSSVPECKYLDSAELIHRRSNTALNSLESLSPRCEGKSEGIGEASVPMASCHPESISEKVDNDSGNNFYTASAITTAKLDSDKSKASTQIAARSKKSKNQLKSLHKASTAHRFPNETTGTFKTLFHRLWFKKVVQVDENTYSFRNFAFAREKHEFSCLGCDFKTNSKDLEIGTRVLKKHIILSHDVKPAKPSEAVVRLIDEATQTYMAYGHKFQSVEEGYKCSTCSKILKPRKVKKSENQHRKYLNIKNHIQFIHMGTRRGNCPICNVYTTHVSTHMAHKHPKNKTEQICDICGKSFKPGRLGLHMATHQDVSEYKHQCDRCGKKFLLKPQLNVHYRTHTGEKPYVCEKCGRGFAFQHVFKTHLNGHEKIRPFACNQCEWTFGAKFLLVRHIKQVHEGIKVAQPKKVRKKEIPGTGHDL